MDATYCQSHPHLSYKEELTQAKHSYTPSRVGSSLNSKDTTALIKASYDKDIGDFKVD